jgi:putative oxidoreductase
MSIDTRGPQSLPHPSTDRSSTAAARTPFSWLADVADLVITILKPIAVPMLRIALGVVYVWFGILKIIGASPIADLVASMMPFLPAETAVIGLGIVEVALGLALIAGLFVPWIAAAQVLHLLGTFAVFVFQPAVVHTGNPFLVTMEGEFIGKNLVLVAGLIVVACHTGQRRAE